MSNHYEPAAKRLERPPKIFSGKSSKEMWKCVNKCKGKVAKIFFELLCRCQDLEDIIKNLEKRIANLENE